MWFFFCFFLFFLVVFCGGTAAHPISSFFHVSTLPLFHRVRPFLTIPCIIGSMHLSRGMAALSFAPEIDTLKKKFFPARSICFVQ